MKKKVFWVGLSLLALAVIVLIAAWPRYLPVEPMHGDAEWWSFEEMVDRAELIVLAEVKSVKQGPDFVSSTGQPDPDHGVIRVPTQRVTLDVVKVYQGEFAPNQTLTLYQGYVGVTWTGTWRLPFFMINENDPIYERGERYVLMLIPASIPEELKPFQPAPWQEGMVAVIHPDGRMRLNADGTVTSVLNSFGTNGNTLDEIEAKIKAAMDSLPKYHLEQAREALITYFSLLHSQRYDEASHFYGGSYDLLRDWNPSVDPNDYAALFENGCMLNGLMCLPVQRVVQEEQVSTAEFNFTVEFTNEDGSLLVSGSETLPQSQFTFMVLKDEDGKFLVQDLPVYTP